jgi:hypothetical protein
VVNFGGASATDTRQGKMHSGKGAFVMMTNTSADSESQISISANERRSVLSVPTAISWALLILFILAALQISVAILFAVHRTEIWDAIETFNPSAAKETLAIIALGTSIGSVMVHVLFAVLYFSLASFHPQGGALGSDCRKHARYRSHIRRVAIFTRVISADPG